MPIYFDDLESSLKATMIFPREPEKAAALAAWLSIRDLHKAISLGHEDQLVSTLGDDSIRGLLQASCAASDFAPLYSEAYENLRVGAHAAVVVSYLWAFICEEGQGASWERAVRAVETKSGKLPVSRSSLFKALNSFKPVLHLLGARAMLKRRGDGRLENTVQFAAHPDPAVGYDRGTDVLVFAGEARKLQVALLVWESRRSSKGQLFNEMFDLIGLWTPPPRQPQWPKMLQIRGIGLDDDIKTDPQFTKRRAGRKPKLQS
jgi:hypothetical protein